MNTIHARATAVIDAPPAAVYAVISDYRVAHPAILPRPYFSELIVEAGGQGEGTVTRVRMEVMGRKYAYHQRVTEPDPGRVLTETDIETGQASTFIIEPLDDGRRSHVTIAADFPASPGFQGVLERIFTPPITRGIFQKELANLANYLQQQRVSAVPA